MKSDTDILVIASGPYISAFDAAVGGRFPAGVRAHELSLAEQVPEAIIGDATQIVVEVDPRDAGAMRRLSALRNDYPHIPLIAAIGDASVSLVRTLVRQGVSDVVALPLEPDELMQVVLEASVRRDTQPRPAQKLAPLVAVARSIGGCGATSIATHLAADLAEHAGDAGAVIVDLDLQFGNVGIYLGVNARGTLNDLLEAGDRLDDDLLTSTIGEATEGLSVITAPEAILPLESVDIDQLLRVIHLLRQRFGYVVLDLPANWTNWTLSAALAANSIILVCELSIASLRQARRRLELFSSVGIESSAVEIVVNRVENRLFKTIDLDDVSRTLNHRVLGKVSLEAPLVSTSQDQGMLTNAVHRKSKFMADVRKLSQLLRDSSLKRED
ncbi:AAA family ATPase [Novosphingobium pentaromativorans]|uniref:AAA family ATPase n=1 Tax=Novosphingobium pentaromativorans TaxID=205844 RepID=UPI0002E60F65|nr:P-loop NTPase [Novosphingobium pentaromativorans]